MQSWLQAVWSGFHPAELGGQRREGTLTPTPWIIFLMSFYVFFKYMRLYFLYEFRIISRSLTSILK